MKLHSPETKCHYCCPGRSAQLRGRQRYVLIMNRRSIVIQQAAQTPFDAYAEVVNIIHP